MAILERIIEETRALSPSEKLKLRQALDRELVQPAIAPIVKVWLSHLRTRTPLAQCPWR
jgi:hypothetical protein